MKTNEAYLSDREISLEILKYLKIIAGKRNAAPKPVLADIGYITNEDLMEMFHVKRGTTTMWRNTEALRYTKIGGRIYYKMSDVMDMMNQHFQRH